MHWTLGLLLQILISLVFLPLPKIGAKKKGGKKIGEMLWQFKYLLCDIHPTIHYNMHTNIFEIIIIIDNLLFLAFCLSYFKSIVLVLVLLFLEKRRRPKVLEDLYLEMFFLAFSNFLINSPERLRNASAPIDFIS